MEDTTTHVVAEGEWVSAIAVAAGYAQWQSRVWKLEANRELREKRDPYVLAPGDELALPADREKLLDAACEKLHRFKLPAITECLYIRLLKPDFQPIVKGSKASSECEYAFDDPSKRGTVKIDDRGFVSIPYPPGCASVTLKFEEDRGAGRIAKHRVRCKIGTLKPLHDSDPREVSVTGVQQRLHSMGFCPGPTDGKLGPRTRAAMATFAKVTRDGKQRGALGTTEVAPNAVANSDALWKALMKAYGA